MRCGVQGDERGSAFEVYTRYNIVSLSDNLDYCEAPSLPDWGSKVPDSTSRVLIDHLPSRYTRYERLSPIQSTTSNSFTVGKLNPRTHVSQAHAAAHELVYRGIGTRSQQSYDGNMETAKLPSLTPPALVAIGDANTQSLNVWNRRGLYCVRGGSRVLLPYMRVPRNDSSRQVVRSKEERRNNSPIQG